MAFRVVVLRLVFEADVRHRARFVVVELIAGMEAFVQKSNQTPVMTPQQKLIVYHVGITFEADACLGEHFVFLLLMVMVMVVLLVLVIIIIVVVTPRGVDGRER